MAFAVVVVVVVVVVEFGPEDVGVVGAVAAEVDGAGTTGRNPGSSGTISSLAGVVLLFVAGVDFDVEVEDGGLLAAGFDAAGLEPGGVGSASGWKGVGVTDGVGGIGTCPAAKLIAASDSATRQTGRSTRFM